MTAPVTSVTLNLHRGPMLTGRVHCGKNQAEPPRLVSVIITDRRDPSWTPENAHRYVLDLGPWVPDTLPKYLEAEAMLHAAACGFYIGGVA